MGGMPMAHTGTMSSMWMCMPEQTWLGAAASFLGMWIVMMAAMMLPSLLPMLGRYRRVVSRIGEIHLAALTAVVSAGYFFVWTLIGVVVFSVGAAITEIEMRHPALARVSPIVASLVVAIAGVVQFTAWKARRLGLCNEVPRLRAASADVSIAWRHGLRLGLYCSQSCAGLMAILLVMGVMDLRIMGVVTAGVTVERLAPNGARAARAIGAIAASAGLFMLALAIRLS
jgi:predicted metal-binding membrane protein